MIAPIGDWRGPDRRTLASACGCTVGIVDALGWSTYLPDLELNKTGRTPPEASSGKDVGEPARRAVEEWLRNAGVTYRAMAA